MASSPAFYPGVCPKAQVSRAGWSRGSGEELQYLCDGIFLWKELIPYHGIPDVFIYFPQIFEERIQGKACLEKMSCIYLCRAHSHSYPKNPGRRSEWCEYHACLGRKIIALPHSHSASIWKSLTSTVRDCQCWECPGWCVCRTHLANISKWGGGTPSNFFVFHKSKRKLNPANNWISEVSLGCSKSVQLSEFNTPED